METVRKSVAALAFAACCLEGTPALADVDGSSSRGAGPETFTDVPPVSPSPTFLPESSKVDVNHATMEQIRRIPPLLGSEQAARDIVTGRPYSSMADLLDRGRVPREAATTIWSWVSIK